MTANPPRWAASVLGLLLRPADRASIAGDLLEEYRDAKVPLLGKRAADRWYVRQVMSLLWRLAGTFGLVAAAALVVRILVDAFVPTTAFQARAASLSWAMILVFGAAGLSAAWQTGHVRSGTLAAITSSLIGSVVALALVAVVASIDSTRTDPGGPGEWLVMPLIFLTVGVVLGSVGGAVGKLLHTISNRQSAISNS